MSAAATSITFAQLEAENGSLRERLAELEALVADLKHDLDWFRRQLFGAKSEKRHEFDLTTQGDLLAGLAGKPVPAVTPTETISYTRRQKTRENCVTDEGLRFDASVPVTEVRLPCPEIEGLDKDDYEIIGEKITCRLRQRPASYEVLKLIRPVAKLTDGRIVTAPAPANVLERSVADVTFLAGMLVDKLAWHLPLHRQHQRLSAAGITLSRQSLTNLSGRAIELLRPIWRAQYAHVLESRVLTLDETSIKAGVLTEQHAMKKAYFWPIYGEDHELVFPYTPQKSYAELTKVLGGWTGTLVSDGAKVYDLITDRVQGMRHANCWAHSRRRFEAAKEASPKESAEALELIGRLYRVEREIRQRGLTGTAKLAWRQQHALPACRLFQEWCEAQTDRAWSSVEPMAKALGYVRNRGASLEVYLGDPDVPIDTNHLEAGLRPIPMGRKNWLFCWTELGAEHIGIAQSLVATCRLHDVQPFTYLVDVLQRVGEHPASDAIALTPRVWKQRFADNPLRAPFASIR